MVSLLNDCQMKYKVYLRDNFVYLQDLLSEFVAFNTKKFINVPHSDSYFQSLGEDYEL